MSEHQNQAAFFSWCELHLKRYPELRWIHAIPNGGKRNVITAVNMKREGVRPGVHDMFLPHARGGHHGLYIEFKDGNNDLTSKQVEFKEFIEENGYASRTCWSVDQAIEVVRWYFSLEV